jgi:hypothetical protein
MIKRKSISYYKNKSILKGSIEYKKIIKQQRLKLKKDEDNNN